MEPIGSDWRTGSRNKGNSQSGPDGLVPPPTSTTDVVYQYIRHTDNQIITTVNIAIAYIL